ncbi:MAG: SufD family Fe-S cluster assembly protein, partial [Candidatus Aerophobetes bacterium]|nr:SufD family Fe-S cluster assembly protein [Candidatus Aerophobetes bacterium]
EGIQEIIMDILLEDNSSVELLAHCTFPNAVKVKHIMEAKIKIGRGSSLKYSEVHYHGLKGGIEVIPKAEVEIAPGGRFYNNFTLIQGRVGKLAIDYNVKVKKRGVVELIAKAYGREEDKIKIKESVFLNGEEAKGLTKSRVVVIDKATSEIIGETYGNAPGARGHVDCVEIVEGEAKAEAIPKVSVSNSEAKVTHEAAIGRIDKKQIETLMARGLDEAEAINVVIGGMLK